MMGFDYLPGSYTCLVNSFSNPNPIFEYVWKPGATCVVFSPPILLNAHDRFVAQNLVKSVSLSIDMGMLFSCVLPSVAFCVVKKCHAIPTLEK